MKKKPDKCFHLSRTKSICFKKDVTASMLPSIICYSPSIKYRQQWTKVFNPINAIVHCAYRQSCFHYGVLAVCMPEESFSINIYLHVFLRVLTYITLSLKYLPNVWVQFFPLPYFVTFGAQDYFSLSEKKMVQHFFRRWRLD